MSEYQIQYVDKAAHGCEHITHVGGDAGGGWKLTVQAVIHNIVAQHRFYTMAAGVRAYVEVATSSGGRQYLRTERNGTTTDNLLNLPRIPASYALVS